MEVDVYLMQKQRFITPQHTPHRSGITQLPHIIHTSSQCHPLEPTEVPKYIQTQWYLTMQKSTHTTLKYHYQARYATPVKSKSLKKFIIYICFLKIAKVTSLHDVKT